MSFCEWLAYAGRKLEVAYSRMHRQIQPRPEILGELSHSSCVLFSPYTGTRWKPLMKAILGQLWSHFAILYAWCFVPGAFPSFASQWHFSSNTGCCDAEHWEGFRRTGEKHSLFSFHKREQEEHIGFSPFPEPGSQKGEYKMGLCTGTFWDIHVEKAGKGLGTLED